MSDPASGMQLSEKPPAERLDSWKEIAAYLGRDVTTVQRWEKHEGMPIHRHVHDKRGSVYAFHSELDTWRAGRNPRAEENNGSPPRNTAPPAAKSESISQVAGLVARRRWIATIGAGSPRSALARSCWLPLDMRSGCEATRLPSLRLQPRRKSAPWPSCPSRI